MRSLAPDFGGSRSLHQVLRPRPLPIRNHAGRVVGSIRLLSGRLTFFKTVDPERHRLRCPLAWANDRAVLEQAAHAGAEWVCHQERDSRRRWWVPLAAFEEYGFPVSRGFGEQTGLALEYWCFEDPGAPVQLDLFGRTS